MLALAASRRGRHQFRQFAGCCERLIPATVNDLRCDLAGARFFAEVTEDAFQFGLVGCPQQFVSRLSLRSVKPQVERSFAVESKSAILVGQLIRRVAEVQQDSIDTRDMKLSENRGQFGVTGVNQVTVRKVEDDPRSCEHLRIPIQTDQDSAGAELFEDVLTVSAGAHGAVYDGLPGFHGQQPQHIPNQNRLMNRSAGITGRRRHDSFPATGE